MKRYPNRFYASNEWAQSLLDNQAAIPSVVPGDKIYVPARRWGWQYSRWKLALDVFLGKADALYWTGQ